jgi:hypothetical protein
MNKQYHFIDAQTDKFGDRHTLWHVGNYHYEIECRSTGNKIDLPDTSFEQAKQVFQDVLVSY